MIKNDDKDDNNNKGGQEVHTFHKSLKVGEEGERVLDSHFINKFEIEPVEMTDQRKGIDRTYTHRLSGAVCTVEYKTDMRAAETGNVFIEVWSNTQKKKKGWAYTSQAQWLYFYMPGFAEVGVIEMTRLKMQLPAWEDTKAYRKVPVVNSSGNTFYTTEGILVPVDVFKEVCYEIITVGIKSDDEDKES